MTKLSGAIVIALLVGLPRFVGSWPFVGPSVEASFTIPVQVPDGFGPSRSPSGVIMVKTTGAKGLWLGCSIRDTKTGRVLEDLKPNPVPDSGKYMFDLEPGRQWGTQLEYVVSLWKGVKQDTGSRWGVLMVDQVASTGWKPLRPDF